MRNFLSLFLVSLLIVSCNQKQSDNSTNMSMVEETVLADQQTQNDSPQSIYDIDKQEVSEKKIIKDGRLGVRVSDLENTKSRIDSLIIGYEGYYANERLNNSDW